MNIRYRVELSEAERAQLAALSIGGKHAARKIRRAQFLLAADGGIGDETIAASVSVGGSTVYRTGRRFVDRNLELALGEETRPGAPRGLSGKETALPIATACSSPPNRDPILDRCLLNACGVDAPHDLTTRPVRLAVLESTPVEHLLPALRVGALRQGLWLSTYVATYGQYSKKAMEAGSAS
jgi:hypothetical protein